MQVNLYLILQNFGVEVHAIRRTGVTVNRLTGERTSTEVSWDGTMGYIPKVGGPKTFYDLSYLSSSRLHVHGGEVVTFDAWFIMRNEEWTPVDKDEIHYAGDKYVVAQISNFGDYSIAAVKSVAKGESRQEVVEELNGTESLNAVQS